MSYARFIPTPDDQIRLFGQSYVFQAHPAVPTFVWGCEGAKSTVYMLKGHEPGGASGNNLFALKAFKTAFRSERNSSSALRLNLIKHFEGMSAARRWVVSAIDEAAIHQPGIKYAVLMPFIPGRTWYDYREAFTSERGMVLSPSELLILGTQLLKVVAALERAGLAHTDISPGNILLDPKTGSVELLDLEEMYMPGASDPGHNLGTPGYMHPSHGSTWRPEGDRFAAAIIAAEILLMSDVTLAPIVASGVSGQGQSWFQDEFVSGHALAFLHKQVPKFADILHDTLRSPSLSQCQPVSALLSGLSNAVMPHSTSSLLQPRSEPQTPTTRQPTERKGAFPRSEGLIRSQPVATDYPVYGGDAQAVFPAHDSVEVFFAYSHSDTKLRDELEKHLAPLQREGLIEAWHDRKIAPGTYWQQEIDLHLASAKIIILLVSADFLNSDYCYCEEMRKAIQRHRQGEARVIPVVARDADWETSPFAELQAIPTKNGRVWPIKRWSDRDAAWTSVAVSIRRVVKELLPR
jgi:serine/threonine protein kinase